ncbi:DUF4192 domain-containing protein [Actinomadura parmotrematis]|uniref:DUF4192 domain-containing protein n=1 Tax=Actinomadura parmotrematis TaxID=2864039 RepID=A0ABS7G4G1_9ACTN|nr:DUF4192 domain-containing protein [Actinomadura parmotrematis]MBW8487610.1 DUF4192 domain-containing protein [Actinomadura parmotrematis]
MEPFAIRTPEDAIAAVPYLLGFHPSASLVCIGFDGPGRTCAVRQDLPGADRRVAGVLARNGFRRALLVGYGPPGDVLPAVAAMREALTSCGLDTVDALRVADGRWWSLTCPDTICCPAEGTPFEPADSVIAARATFAGHVALADRAELERSLDPLPSDAVRKATARAEARYFSWGGTFRSAADREGVALVVDLLDRARDGLAPPDDDEIAWLGLLLMGIRVRDEAWVRIDEHDPSRDVAFWRDIARRVEPRYAAPPATLLAFAAYASGDGALANIALDRAFAADPAYSAAALIREVMALGVPPAQARLHMTPTDLPPLLDLPPTIPKPPLSTHPPLPIPAPRPPVLQPPPHPPATRITTPPTAPSPTGKEAMESGTARLGRAELGRAELGRAELGRAAANPTGAGSATAGSASSHLASEHLVPACPTSAEAARAHHPSKGPAGRGRPQATSQGPLTPRTNGTRPDEDAPPGNHTKGAPRANVSPEEAAGDHPRRGSRADAGTSKHDGRGDSTPESTGAGDAADAGSGRVGEGR